MSSSRTKNRKPRERRSLAKLIREAAADSGLSVYRIAKQSGVDQSTLNKFLAGTRKNLRLDVADRLFWLFFDPPPRRRRISTAR